MYYYAKKVLYFEILALSFNFDFEVDMLAKNAMLIFKNLRTIFLLNFLLLKFIVINQYENNDQYTV